MAKATVLKHILHHGSHANLHAGAEYSVDTGFQNQHIAHVDGGDEIQVIHARSYGNRPSVTEGRRRELRAGEALRTKDLRSSLGTSWNI